MPATTPPDLRACAVRVPCSTSNLGSGFDCVGLAFDRYLDAGYEPAATAGAAGYEPASAAGGAGGEPAASGKLHIRRGGTLASLEVAPADDLLVTVFLAELRRRGAGPVGGTLFVTSEIPIGVGLGSSAAAVVAGLALAAAACGTTLDRDAALASAAVAEGHPDNAAPALLGGLVAVTYTEHSTPRALPLPLSGELGFAFAAPDVTVPTQRARAALPQHVPHSAASRNIGRVAALLYGLAHGDRTALAAGFTDELHVPYRLPLIPGAAAVVAAAAQAGAWATTISGAGSGLLAVCPTGMELRVADAMQQAFAAAGHAGISFVVRSDPHGAQPRDMIGLRRLFTGRDAT
jgi:homoserine kinase